MLKFDLEQARQITTITSEDKEFEGTFLAGTGFEIDLKNMLRSEKDTLLMEVQKKDTEITAIEYGKILLYSHIEDMRGIEFTNGEEKIEGEIEQLNVFYDLAPEILIKTLNEAISNFKIVAEEKKSDSEIAQENSQTGM